MPYKPVILILVALAVLGVPAFSKAQNTNAPPRNVDDILAVLDQYKPDPALAEKSRVEARLQPPDTQDRAALADFYLQRAYAARAIGAATQQIADLRLAIEHSAKGTQIENRAHQELAAAEQRFGSLLTALRIREWLAQNLSKGFVGSILSSYNGIVSINLALGDLASARRALASAEKVYGERHARDPKNSDWYEHERLALLESMRATLFATEGKVAEAERARRRALTETGLDVAVNRTRLAKNMFTVSQDTKEIVRDGHELQLGYILLRQGKLTEAEMSARNVLTRILSRVGRYSEQTSGALRALGAILLESGRFRDAEQIARAAIDIDQKTGAIAESAALINDRRNLAAALVAQQRWPEALAEFESIVASVKGDAQLAQRYAVRDINWAIALIKNGQAVEAVTMVDALTKRTSARLSDSAYDTAQVRGVLAMALAASGNRERALDEFRRALPVLLAYSSGDGDAENGGVVRATRLRYILEAYIDLLTGQQQAPGVEAIAESFRIADAARGSSVQRALFESAARASISDAGLAALARDEQDARVRLGVLTSLLGRLLGAPPDEQLPKVIAGIRAEIENLRAQRAKLKSEIEKRFPDYANLVDPKPVTLQQVRAALKPGEALISVYVGQDKTYVWAVPREGTPAFAAVPLGDKALSESVGQLRKALDIGNTAIARFPRFDAALAHRLYNDLLKPVETGWKDATSLIIVPHRALGQLPFSLLVTAPADVGADTAAPFDGYRAVPWLLRKAAVTQLPSVNALTTLRALPAVTANRREFIGFGDPYFSKTQQAEAASQERVQVAALSANLRNLRIDTVALPIAVEPGDAPDSALRNAPKVANSSTLAQLARLPETADEIRDIAQALKADPKTDVFLGVQANEKNVKSMNLADRKVIAFATHGLVPGDLNGLEQPALALTAPDVAGIDGDGLLTMEEILALKLNADWVVLSACNTGSGDGAGSEAISGLGRAFFYAGARSLLVSNWPVETVSAKLLTTDVFKRSSENPSLTRAESLRQTMLWLLDNAGQRDASGKLEFSYAHPMFWAPFVLIGDGGR